METGTVNPVSYAQVLASQIGLSFGAIPETVIDEIRRKKTKSGVNEVLIPWYQKQKETATRTTDLTPDIEEMLKNMGGPRTLRDIQSLKSNIEQRINQINRWQRDIYNYSQACEQDRIKMDMLLGKPSNGMLDAVKEITKDNWYMFDSKGTKEFNETKSEELQRLFFVTPEVYLKWVNSDLNKTFHIPMGQFSVQLRMSDFAVYVKPLDPDRKSVGGYYHPHVGTGGDVCWGNGANAVSQALKDYNPAPIFATLRIILTTYNDESPYITAVSVAAQYSPEIMSQIPPRFEVYDENYTDNHTDNYRALMYTKDIPEHAKFQYPADGELDSSEIEEEYSIDDLSVVRVYVKVHDDGTRLDDDFYFKCFDSSTRAITWPKVNTNKILRWVY